MAVFGFIFLSIGMGLGAVWAYVVLGWGGFWAWDAGERQPHELAHVRRHDP
ncbi:MAG: hypothetical protein ACLTSX_11415 [Collinsella sp.]